MTDLLNPVRKVAKAAKSAAYQVAVGYVQAQADRAKVDAEVAYPSYKSMDAHIDVDRLKSLDPILRERLIRRDDEQFWTGPLTMRKEDNQVPGSRQIYLRKSIKPGYRYFDLNKPERWEPAPEADLFPEVMDFIATLPFKAIGRALIMYDFNGHPVTAHRDHYKTADCHEFIWFRTNLHKPFFMANKTTGERKYVDGHSAWFDTVNQFHGADATTGFSVSLRVDGLFTDELRALMPKPKRNLASTPSLWAIQGDRASPDSW